jgi:hypothetical protein
VCTAAGATCIILRLDAKLSGILVPSEFALNSALERSEKMLMPKTALPLTVRSRALRASIVTKDSLNASYFSLSSVTDVYCPNIKRDVGRQTCWWQISRHMHRLIVLISYHALAVGHVLLKHEQLLVIRQRFIMQISSFR